VRGGHGTITSGYGRYSSEKMAQEKHCSRRVNQRIGNSMIKEKAI
jgi:hypothetical protein